MGSHDRDSTAPQAAAQAVPGDDTQDAGTEVAGHLQDFVMADPGRLLGHDRLAEVDRERRGVRARPNERDGGLLDKIRRRLAR